MNQVVFRVLLKTGGGIDFLHTGAEAKRFLEDWNRNSTADVAFLHGITQDGVTWIIQCKDIAGLLIMPYRPTQPQLASSPMLGRS